MAEFTELVATAIANAESRAELRVRVEEQAALRRVATLVARGVSANELFEAVAEEVGLQLGADATRLLRFEGTDAATILAGHGEHSDRPPVGSRVTLEGENVTAMVLRTGQTARLENFDHSSGSIAEIARELGVRSTVGAPIIVEGRRWGVAIASWSRAELPPGDIEERLSQFTELLATAIANAESRGELAASRARVVTAGAQERQRMVRDLHDGAQQRLVHAVITLKLALRELDSGERHVEEYVTEALDHAQQANFELRELVHGILPAVLTSGGLRAGVEDLASHCSLPLTVDVSAERFPPAIEATGYFVVSEALTNAVKHARAQVAAVAAHARNGSLQIEVRDDGVGGADPDQGSGLTGLRDRVEALGGGLQIDSPPGSGTSVLVRIPIEGR